MGRMLILAHTILSSTQILTFSTVPGGLDSMSTPSLDSRNCLEKFVREISMSRQVSGLSMGWTQSFFMFSAPAYNTFSPESAHEVQQNNLAQANRTSTIKTFRVMTLIEKHLGDRPIDLLSMDIEGLDEKYSHGFRF